MTERMREALSEARKGALRRVHTPGPGKPQWPAASGTLAALCRRGLLEYSEIRNRHGYRVEVWSITEAGEQELKPREIYKEERPKYLSRGALRYRVLRNGRWAIDDSGHDSGDYTSDPRKSIDRDLAPNARARTAVPVLVQDEDLHGFAMRARQREEGRKRKNHSRLDSEPLRARVAEVERRARERRADVASDVRLILHMLDSGREKHAVRRIEQLEVGLGQRAA